MSCEDDSGHFLHSDSLEFSTRHISSLRNRDSTHSGDNKSDYLTEMNLKLLPAISNSIQESSHSIGDDPIKVSTSSLSRSYYGTKKTSPHAVLGRYQVLTYLYKLTHQIGSLGCVSLLTVPLTGYGNGKVVNCLSLKTTINATLAQCSPNCCF